MSIKPLTSMLMTQREQLSCLKQLHKQSFQPHSTIIHFHVEIIQIIAEVLVYSSDINNDYVYDRE